MYQVLILCELFINRGVVKAAFEGTKELEEMWNVAEIDRYSVRLVWRLN